MFFSKLFKKDHRHYFNQGGKHLAAERYADARVDFLEAQKLCPADASQDQGEIQAGLTLAGDKLGELNLQEGEHSVNAGDLAKAYDHFALAAELAFDETIRAMAREKLAKLEAQAAAAEPHQHKHADHGAHSGHGHGGGGCGGSCSCSGGEATEQEAPPMEMSEEDRFSLLVHPLPGDLPQRYLALGPDFAKAYLLIQDGNDAAAFQILQEMPGSADNDVVIYEVALIMYRSGQVHECEKLLNRSLQLNPGNSMSYLGLVHLFSDQGRHQDALGTVQRMLELGVMADQAQIMLGDLHQAAGAQEAAMEAWTAALSLPTVARSAAERLVPVLDKQGRKEEVKYLAKKYLKGCC
jgi:tetratricopeptide (TPR) repeat protein